MDRKCEKLKRIGKDGRQSGSRMASSILKTKNKFSPVARLVLRRGQTLKSHSLAPPNPLAPKRLYCTIQDISHEHAQSQYQSAQNFD